MINTINDNRAEIGGKAAQLQKLEQLGFHVPKWIVIPHDALVLHEAATPDTENHVLPPQVTEQLKQFFDAFEQTKTFAVRSSAVQEDGQKHSFAGQFESFLHVAASDVPARVLETWKSVQSERAMAYRRAKSISSHPGMSVIVQEMITPEVSGVAFGMDPVSGSTEKIVISAVYGLGEGLVSGELDADTYTLSGDQLDSRLVRKELQVVRDEVNGGTRKEIVALERQQKPTLTKDQLSELARALTKLEKELGSPQDVEFAYVAASLYILQTRPVTTRKQEVTEEYILWDNSNIIESYPGVTTPLTFSFIVQMYEMAYRQFVGIMGVKQSVVERHKAVFANTLGLVRGRVYYNLRNWYKMLAMLPGYSINAENMERMMGVKERFELEEEYKMNKGQARLRIAGMVLNMVWKHLRLPKERRRFQHHLNQEIARYKAMDFEKMPAEDIIRRFNELETSLLLKWKAPLVNDFFAMIWFGMLQKQAEKYFPDQQNIHNDLLCGSQDIISVEPIHQSIAIANAVAANPKLKSVFLDAQPAEVWKEIQSGSYPLIKEQFDHYFDQFGNRCIGELKLETISYTEDPTLFVKVIQSYVKQGITTRRPEHNIEEKLKSAAEGKVKAVFRRKPLQKWWFNLVKRKARDLVSNRENLRYERTRAFGMVRRMFTALGNYWYDEKLLKHPRDIFYLTLSEIKASEQQFDPQLLGNIEQRKQEFADYRSQKAPQERFYTYGHTFSDAYIYSDEKLEGAVSELKGVGCCPGKVQGKVRVVNDPKEISSLDGDILVTSSTDPGWVTLFPTAAAIIVERGSLLSHSAIVSREMGIPCIVGVTGLLRTLKSGDTIWMDGSTGEIKQLKDVN